MTTPCPSCVETIADLRQAVSDAIHNAYVSGALDVHNNYQEDRDPSFGEAAADYVASLDVNDMLAHFLPKSPAQLLAEECPHGMTEEQAQWVLDQRAERDEALAGYRAAVAFISADSWDGCSDCIEVLKAARAADWNNEMAGNSDAVAEHLKRIRKHYTNPVEATPTDTAPRYVFGPVLRDVSLNYGDLYIWEGDYKKIIRQVMARTTLESNFRRAYRIGQTYPHNGGECPVADGSVRVRVVYGDGAPPEEVQANVILWDNVTSFTILDRGLNNG